MAEAVLRDVETADLPAVLQLNEAATPHVNRVTLEAMHWFAEHATYFRVAERSSQIIGFLIALGPDSEYDSPNYLWFSHRYQQFLYVDRVVVDVDDRGGGIGTRFYADLIQFAAGLVPIITCEVNSRPPNEASMAFHQKFDFRPVGTQETEGGAKSVVLMTRRL